MNWTDSKGRKMYDVESEIGNALSPEPETSEKLVLVYERGDGTTVEYPTTTHEAWTNYNDPYYQLNSSCEGYDDIGSAYYVRAETEH